MDKKVTDPISVWAKPNDYAQDKEPSPVEIMINEMLSKENIEMKTDLTDGLILALTKGTIFADLYDNDLMRSLVKTVSLYRVSKGRKGRDEIKEMARSLGTMIDSESPSMLSRLFKGE